MPAASLQRQQKRAQRFGERRAGKTGELWRQVGFGVIVKGYLTHAVFCAIEFKVWLQVRLPVSSDLVGRSFRLEAVWQGRKRCSVFRRDCLADGVKEGTRQVVGTQGRGEERGRPFVSSQLQPTSTPISSRCPTLTSTVDTAEGTATLIALPTATSKRR